MILHYFSCFLTGMYLLTIFLAALSTTLWLVASGVEVTASGFRGAPGWAKVGVIAIAPVAIVLMTVVGCTLR